MRAFLSLMICVALVAVLLVTGCGKKDDTATTAKTQKEYDEQAVKEVDPDNPEGELDKLTKEIDADAE